MVEQYTDRLLDHYRHPRYQGLPVDSDAPGEVRQVQEYNPLCGDRVTVALRLVDGVVAQAHFDGRGCALCLGAADILCETVQGRPIVELASLDRAAFLAQLQTEPRPARLKCALLPWIAFRRVLFGGEDESEW